MLKIGLTADREFTFINNYYLCSSKKGECFKREHGEWRKGEWRVLGIGHKVLGYK